MPASRVGECIGAVRPPHLQHASFISTLRQHADGPVVGTNLDRFLVSCDFAIIHAPRSHQTRRSSFREISSIIVVTLRRGPPGNRNQTDPQHQGSRHFDAGEEYPNATIPFCDNTLHVDYVRLAIATKELVVAVPFAGVTGILSIGWPSTRISNRKAYSSLRKRT